MDHLMAENIIKIIKKDNQMGQFTHKEDKLNSKQAVIAMIQLNQL
jgi:hypothetical protein